MPLVKGKGSETEGSSTADDNELFWLHVSDNCRVEVTGNTIQNSRGSGIDLTFCNDTTIIGNIVRNSGQNASADYRDGIFIYKSDYFDVSHNIVVDDQTSATQRCGINQTGNTQHGKIESNTLYGNVGGAIDIDSSNVDVRYNKGFVTENSGTATNLANGGTIAHSLAGTPDVAMLTCLNVTYDSEPVIVAWDQVNTDSTNISLDIYWANGTAITDSVIHVSWYAEYPAIEVEE